MDINKLIYQTRSFRRFDSQRPIATKLLEQFVDAARLGGSARNLQPLKYMLCHERQDCQRIFPHLGWAGYLPDWPGPAEQERPTAYIFCLLDTHLAPEADIDLGIASQNILLSARALGIGGCRIASFPAKLSTLLSLPDHLVLKLVIALGYPAEQVSLVEATPDGSIKYWHGPESSHFVPKRHLSEILLPLNLSPC